MDRSEREVGRQRLQQILGGLTAVLVCGCGPQAKQNVGPLSANQVIARDVCDVQGYHDAIAFGHAEPPTIKEAVEVEPVAGGAPAIGRATIAYETPFQVQQARRLLMANWDDLPDELAEAEALTLDVSWVEKQGLRRILADEPAKLVIGSEAHELPFHPCLSEFVYGRDVYLARGRLQKVDRLGHIKTVGDAVQLAEQSKAPVKKNANREGRPPEIRKALNEIQEKRAAMCRGDTNEAKVSPAVVHPRLRRSAFVPEEVLEPDCP